MARLNFESGSGALFVASRIQRAWMYDALLLYSNECKKQKEVVDLRGRSYFGTASIDHEMILYYF